MTKRDADRQIKKWKKKLRLLKGWKIVFNRRSKYKGQCSIGMQGRKQIIYDWGYGKAPKDYILHEMLHCCARIIREEKVYKLRRDKEEVFVQDLCLIIFGDKKKWSNK